VLKWKSKLPCANEVFTDFPSRYFYYGNECPENVEKETKEKKK
jgi:hypothetical protein